MYLAGYPEGVPGPEHFELVTESLPELGPGQVLVENRFLSVDPYMRGRMQPGSSYSSPWGLGEPLDGDAVGIVTASRNPDWPEGSWVRSEVGMRDRFIASEGLQALGDAPDGYDHSAYLGPLGPTGVTAYFGVVEILDPQPGETVLISSAAGSVGSIAGQIARLKGARVIGSTGTAEKARTVSEDYGFDAAFSYRDVDFGHALDELAPEGIDCFFDNVGGEQLEAAIDRMRVHGRIAKCGAISSYNSRKRAPGPTNLHLVFGRRLTIVGYLVSDHRDGRDEIERKMRGWLERGEMKADQTVYEGMGEVGRAFSDLFDGSNVGKSVIAVPAGSQRPQEADR